MSTWKNKRLNRWNQTRQKGRGSYVLKTTLIAGGSVLSGKTIGFVLFDKTRIWTEFWFDFGLSAVVLLVLGVALGLIAWSVSESWYRREVNKQERT
ncbi:MULTISPECIES: hypothetical protein [unclassified Vibrio]|uniref:hypothetical protein n=1 Tax=unclassified Vibrio TaxID=2614977 RepID=UPI000D0BE86E|nr:MULTISPECIES: hypothetical protein [unclassified Vibrio]NAX19117.1 hypothetical protein [Vibrio sp. V22_P2S10T140]PSD43246.1 hypothetical protein C7E22_01490 [Vibrio sp. V02_P2A34T13]